MSFPYTRAATTLAMIGGLLTATGAWAATAAQDLSGLSPQQREHHARLLAKQQQQQQQLRAQGGGTYRLDIEPPKVVSFAAGTLVDLQKPQKDTLPVTFSLTDNLVGVERIELRAQSASGFQEASGSKSVSLPTRRLDVSVPLSFWGDADEGEWQVVSASLYDANDNVTFLDAAALSALGNTRFTVVNRSRSDTVAPTVTGGQVLTPSLSRTVAPRGEYPSHMARAAVELRVLDTGVSRVSGVHSVDITYCEDVFFNCIYLQGAVLNPGKGNAKIAAAGTIYRSEAVGRYRIESVSVRDTEGNSRGYYAGDTDFDALFGADSSITITE